jgi:hypothetical protein
MAFTTSNLLDAIARRSFMPTGQTAFSSADRLALADEVMLTEVVPWIIAVRENYLVYYVDYPLTANQAEYDIPPRAAGLVVREIHLYDGDRLISTDFRQKELDELVGGGAGTPDGFYLASNKIVVHPTPATTTRKIRVYFFLAPSRHVLTSAAGVVSAIDTGTNVVTVASIPAAWATGNVFDLIRQDGGQEPLSFDLTSSLVTGNTITLPSLPSALRVGDYVALAGETPVVQVPAEFRVVLAQAVAAEMLDSQNQPGADKARKKLEALRDAAQKLLKPRVQGELPSIVGSNWKKW